MSLKTRANQLRKDIPALFLAFRRKDVPWTAKASAGLALLYALSPIDLIPDFIPGLGYLDDLIILPLLVLLTIKLIPPGVFEECRQQSEGMWADGKPKKWYYAIPFVLVWMVFLYWIVTAVLRILAR